MLKLVETNGVEYFKVLPVDGKIAQTKRSAFVQRKVHGQD